MRHVDGLFLLSMITALGCPSDPVDADDGGSTGTTDPGDTTDTSAGDDTTSADGTGTDTGETTGSTGDVSSSGGTTEGTTDATTGDTTGDTTGTTDDPTGSTGDTEGTTGDTETSGTTSGASPAVEACEALSELYQECYGYGPPPGYCEELVDYYASYGDGCLDAHTELWSCLSELECEQLELAEECDEEFAAIDEACEGLVPFCGGGGGGGGPGMCEFIAEDCMDGNDYGVVCAGNTCSCTINDMEVMTFPYDGSDCFDPAFFDGLDEACGFPGVFEF